MQYAVRHLIPEVLPFQMKHLLDYDTELYSLRLRYLHPLIH